MPYQQCADDRLARLIESEKLATCGQGSRRTYSDIHKRRFADTLHLCKAYAPDPSARVLDIGRSELTSYLSTFYWNIQTLGLDLALDDGGHREQGGMNSLKHIRFDLLESSAPSAWPDCGPFDLIVFSEVLEHLHVAPEFVFAFLRSLLSPAGVLMCTTPNATEIGKRLRMLAGRNPYERIRLYAGNPGHFREYTQKELVEIGCGAGFHCEDHMYMNWQHGSGRSWLKATLAWLVRSYPSFRSSQVCVFSSEAN